MCLMSRVLNPGRPMGHGIEMSRPTKEAQEGHLGAAPLESGPARALASGTAARHVRGIIDLALENAIMMADHVVSSPPMRQRCSRHQAPTPLSTRSLQQSMA